VEWAVKDLYPFSDDGTFISRRSRSAGWKGFSFIGRKHAAMNLQAHGVVLNAGI
jgi:hypothetical protein